MTIAPKDRSDRLDSWKAIADYLGRDVRTLLRWEKEKGLPVRRVPGGKRQAVFAFVQELDEWLLNTQEPAFETGDSNNKRTWDAVRESQAVEPGVVDVREAEWPRANNSFDPFYGETQIAAQERRVLPEPGTGASFAIVRHGAKRPRRMLTVAAILAATLATGGVLWFLRIRPRHSSAEITQKRLTFNSSDEPIDYFALSPDGQYLAFSDPAGIHIKLLSSGEERLVPRPADVPSDWRWHVATWLPDGTQLVANAYKEEAQQSSWTLSVLGQSPRKLRDGVWVWTVSRDGSHFIFSPETAVFDREIWMMDSDGTNPRKVLELPQNEWYGRVQFSPDGQHLAYTRYQGDPRSFRTSIKTCDLNGNNQAVVVDPGLPIGSLLWLSQNRVVYIRHDLPGSIDGHLWQVSIDAGSGKAIGKPERIKVLPGFSTGDLSASADEKRLVLTRTTQQDLVFIGELTAGGRRMNPPRRMANDEGSDRPTAWTPDSRVVLFDSDRNGTVGIYKRAIDQETAAPLASGTEHLSVPRVSPDGVWILAIEGAKPEVYPSTPFRVLRIPVTGGAPQFVMETKNPMGIACASALATRCVILEQSKQENLLLTLSAFDSIHGRGQVLRNIQKGRSPRDFTTDPATYRFAWGLSPDGMTLGIARRDEPETHIRLLSLTGGPDREIAVKGWPNITGLDWSADGKSLYIGCQSAQGGTLLNVELNGKIHELWQQNGAKQLWGVPSPDGRYLAIHAAVSRSNLWMLENF